VVLEATFEPGDGSHVPADPDEAGGQNPGCSEADDGKVTAHQRASDPRDAELGVLAVVLGHAAGDFETHESTLGAEAALRHTDTADDPGEQRSQDVEPSLGADRLREGDDVALFQALQALRVEESTVERDGDEEDRERGAHAVPRVPVPDVRRVVGGAFAAVRRFTVRLRLLMLEVLPDPELGHTEERRGSRDRQEDHGDGRVDVHHGDSAQEVIQRATAGEARSIREDHSPDERDTEQTERVLHP